MAAKNKRKSLGTDIHSAIAAHVDANAKAHEWAARSLALRQTGRTAQAQTAESKAKFWLRKVLALEAQAAHGKPEGGRAPRE